MTGRRPTPRPGQQGLPAAPGLLAALLVLLPLFAACSADYQARRADRSVDRILRKHMAEVVGSREAEAARPENLALEAEEEPQTDAAPEGPVEPPLHLTLVDAMALAVEGNRDYMGRREDLYLQALRLVGTRHRFSPQLGAILGYLYNNPQGPPATTSGDLSLSMSQILPGGGNLSVGASSGITNSRTTTFNSGLSIQLTQPLLRGAGSHVSHEPLIQAERNLVYEIRDFELFRESFTIDVARRFYALVGQKNAIENQRRSRDSFIFARKKAEALFEVDRASKLDVLRAKRQELRGLDSLIAAEESYEFDVELFRIFLGLPETQPIVILEEIPAFVTVDFDPISAVEVAMQNRLDVLSRREQLEDSERSLAIARNGLLPDLGLSVGFGADGLTESDFDDQRLNQRDYSASLSLDLPIDLVDERERFRSAQISHVRSERSLEEFLENVAANIQRSLRELERREESVRIQEELIEDEERNRRIAQLQFEQGKVDNREVVDADQSLLEAQNSLTSEQINYEIARLELLRELGILFIDDEGMWKE